MANIPLFFLKPKPDQRKAHLKLLTVAARVFVVSSHGPGWSPTTSALATPSQRFSIEFCPAIS